MKKNIFRLIVCILTFSMTVSTNCFAYTEINNTKLSPQSSNTQFIMTEKAPDSVTNFVKNKFEMLIQPVKQNPSMYKLTNNEADNLYLGQCFKMFEIGNIQSSDVYYFPVLYNGRIKEILTVGLNENGSFSATLGKDFSDKLEDVYAYSSKNNPLIIFDYNGLILAESNNKITKLNKPIFKSSLIDSNTLATLLKNKKLDIKNSITENIKNPLKTNITCFSHSQKLLSSDGNTLNVPVVSEETDDGVPHGICWAACIVNYKYHYNLTAANVCDAMGGDYSGASLEKTCDALKHYSLYSNVIYSPLSFERVCNDIDNNNPIIMGYDGELGKHATVIYGYTNNETLEIMDPQYACFKEAYSDGDTFYYYSGSAKLQWCTTIELN